MPFPYLHYSFFSGVIFDWDGVLAETRLDFSPIFKKYFDGRRVPLLEHAERLPEAERSRCLADIAEIEMRGAAASTPIPHAGEFTTWLNSQAIPWCVLTRNCRESLDLAAQTTGFRLPEHVFSREAAHVKPDPRAMLDAAESIGVPAERCLAIGDFRYELIGARRAGMRCALVHCSDAECISLADVVFPRLGDLARAFANDEKFLPWEYHKAAQIFDEEFGEESFCENCENYKVVHVDEPLNAATLEKLGLLASRGAAAFTVDDKRVLTAGEALDAPLISPLHLYADAAQFLRGIFTLRYPLLKIEAGADGTPLSKINI